VVYKVDGHVPEAGAKPGLKIAEFGVATGAHYDTFSLDCNGLGCHQGHLEDIAKRHEATNRGAYDRCGSILIKKLKRIAEGMERGAGGFPVIAFELDLKVYAFSPRFPAGSEECKRKVPIDD
jgi:hypothetical protein